MAAAVYCRPCRANVDADSCGICMSELENGVHLNCGHHFCLAEIQQWMNSYEPNHQNCPYCRQEITDMTDMATGAPAGEGAEREYRLAEEDDGFDVQQFLNEAWQTFFGRPFGERPDQPVAHVPPTRSFCEVFTATLVEKVKALAYGILFVLLLPVVVVAKVCRALFSSVSDCFSRSDSEPYRERMPA